jgi:RNA polymerase sigma factor (sigma-70 family)
MQSPRSPETSPSERTRAPAADAGIRARLGQASEHLLLWIRGHLSRAGLGRAGDLNDQARDVLNEVVLEALRAEDRYDPSRDLLFWLHGIAMNVVRRRVERFGVDRRRRPPEAPEDAERADEALHEQILRALPDQESAGPEEVLALRQDVEERLSLLPEQHRRVLRLYYFEHDQDNDAVALALGVRPATARVQRCRALQAARKGSPR